MTIATLLAAALVYTNAEHVSLVPDKSPPAPGVKLTYSGSIKPSDLTADDSSVRSFRIQFLVTEHTASGGCNVAWVLEEGSGNPRWAWPQRFGTITFNRSIQPASQVITVTATASPDDISADTTITAAPSRKSSRTRRTGFSSAGATAPQLDM